MFIKINEAHEVSCKVNTVLRVSPRACTRAPFQTKMKMSFHTQGSYPGVKGVMPACRTKHVTKHIWLHKIIRLARHPALHVSAIVFLIQYVHPLGPCMPI